MPLTFDLQLCAQCPSILGNIRERNAEINRQMAAAILSPAIVRAADPTLLTMKLEQSRECRAIIEDTLNRAAKGVPLSASSENMDFYNALQVGQAREHLICQKADFDLAKRVMAEYPGLERTARFNFVRIFNTGDLLITVQNVSPNSGMIHPAIAFI